MLSSLEAINTKEIITHIRRNEMHKITTGMGKLATLPIYFDDSSALSIMEMRAKCRRLKVEKDIQLIVVDYLQLIQSVKAESREREIAIISSTLKQIARELEVPVLALAQLNRSVETRTGKDKTPLLSDLRESGSIEQDADVVMFIHRPEYYEKDDNIILENNWKNLAQIIVGKHRNGATGIADLTFIPDFGRFDNRETHTVEPPRFTNRNTEQPTDYSHSTVSTVSQNEAKDVDF
jgi:replicative DNA helicase